MNSIVYAITGGMEDWAYAASWDLDYTQPCQPTEHGGYPKEKTVYTSDMLRTFNILVETADQKVSDTEAVRARNCLFSSSVSTKLGLGIE